MRRLKGTLWMLWQLTLIMPLMLIALAASLTLLIYEKITGKELMLPNDDY